jgi:hypothetical protein
MGDATTVVLMQVRIPRAIWTWLGEQSAANLRSKNSEIILSLRQRMEREQAQREQAVQR